MEKWKRLINDTLGRPRKMYRVSEERQKKQQ
jgi:hypothetical protein